MSESTTLGMDAVMEGRDRVLEAALPDIPFDGWNKRLIGRAGEAAGMGADEAASLFPGGTIDLIAHFSDWADRQMLTRLGEMDLDSLRVRDRIKTAVRTRFEILENHRDAVRRAVGLLAMPANAARAGTLLHQTVDRMWNAAGDTSTDYNWYTKRGLLAGVVSTTTLYWLADRSDGFADTWAFLDRRVDNVLTVGRAIGKARDRMPERARRLVGRIVGQVVRRPGTADSVG